MGVFFSLRGNYLDTYDGENRIQAVDGNTLYVYDAGGNRVAKAASGANIYYIYDAAGRVVSERDANNNWIDTYINFGGRGIGLYRGSNTGFYHQDHLNSTRLVTLSDKSVYENMDYLPFGLQIAGGNGTSHKFTGEERDTESGNDYFTARFYSSSMGRFMTPDPLLWLGWQNPPEDSSEEAKEEAHQKFENWISNPQNFNMYAYVDNNPLNHTDPTGMLGCQAGDKTFTTCMITITYDPKTSKGTLIVTGMNKGDKEATTLLTASVVVGGDGHVTPTGIFHATVWEKDHVSQKYGNAANTPWSKTLLGGNAFGPYQLHIGELEGRGIYIHGTMGPSWSPTTWGNSIFLSPTSHGCVRMCNRDDEALHTLMPNPNGNKVIIQTTPNQ